MAASDSEPRLRERPLSPHLQIYRWQAQMASSILHRATGVILAIGALAFVYGLMALAGGAQRWTAFAECLGSPLGRVLMAGFSWALAYHLINGIRHLLQDGGLGFAIPDFVRNSWISIVGSVVLAALGWVVVLSHWGQA
ncbi:succinate dehydrogenase, cytochrome b556 subunit [Thermomonas sp.]|uniref:succinate dehydrogenase, cytochrome b556 subunit n=1 Tax=Thermomonas sp. TaxID=1971895 RepID=UPI001AC044CC|nr:succinate dehydrogenase, cytochrome b556 subunit [Xanthomonadales bacterium]MBN8795889.1 succinate dehydrogenase, cytochrome b556 subunit [Stenotrophomonas nitritireducens]